MGKMNPTVQKLYRRTRRIRRKEQAEMTENGRFFVAVVDAQEGKQVEVSTSGPFVRIQSVSPMERPVRREPVVLSQYDALTLINVLWDAIDERTKRLQVKQGQYGKLAKDVLKMHDEVVMLSGIFGGE